jgi:hypothetical protein
MWCCPRAQRISFTANSKSTGTKLDSSSYVLFPFYHSTEDKDCQTTGMTSRILLWPLALSLVEYLALENAQLNAYVGLVDGIVLAVRERYNSSQSLLSENSNYTWSVYDSDRDELTRDDMDRLDFRS